MHGEPAAEELSCLGLKLLLPPDQKGKSLRQLCHGAKDSTRAGVIWDWAWLALPFPGSGFPAHILTSALRTPAKVRWLEK